MKNKNLTNLSKNRRIMLVLAADFAPTTNIVLSTLLFVFSCTTPEYFSILKILISSKPKRTYNRLYVTKKN